MEQEELIDKFLLGTLTPEERDQFNDLQENNISFRNDITLIKDLKIVSGAEDRDNLRESIANFESKISAKETKIIPLIDYKKWIIAASILIIASISGILVFNPFATNTAKLYAENFEPYKNVVSPIVRGGNNDSEETIAFTSYEQKNYEVAADQFESLFSVSKRPYYLLYQANALLAANRAKEAIPILEKHITLKGQLSERGRWYLALAYLKENKKEEAIVTLKEIIHNGIFKKGAATQLLKELN